MHEKRVREYKGHKQYEQLLAEAAKQASNHSEKQKVWRALIAWRVIHSARVSGAAVGRLGSTAVLCPGKGVCISLVKVLLVKIPGVFLYSRDFRVKGLSSRCWFLLMGVRALESVTSGFEC